MSLSINSRTAPLLLRFGFFKFEKGCISNLTGQLKIGISWLALVLEEEVLPFGWSISHCHPNKESLHIPWELMRLSRVKLTDKVFCRFLWFASSGFFQYFKIIIIFYNDHPITSVLIIVCYLMRSLKVFFLFISLDSSAGNLLFLMA